MSDALTLDAPRRVEGGYLAVRARAARTGVYSYTGREIDPDNAHGLRDAASVNVLRDDTAVFDERAVRSFIAKPITDDHPTEAVTAANWRDHARGAVMGAIRDGDHLAFDLVLMDQATIAKVEAGKAELSNGYDASLAFGEFTAADGTKCQAKQTAIRGNHVAIVDKGRAGSTCRIGDAALCDSLPSNMLPRTTEKTVKTMLIDGLTVDISNADTAQATIATILAARDAATAKATGLEANIATLATDKATLEAEKATLAAQLADAKNPQALRDAAKAYAEIVGKAKALGVTVTDTMGQAEIVKAVVDGKLGAAAHGWTDAQYTASFSALTVDVKPGLTGVQPIGSPVVLGDAATKEATALTKANDHNAWRTASAA